MPADANRGEGVAGLSAPPGRIVPDQEIRNRASCAGLEWVFGGKAQRGWSLYLALVREEIGADAKIESADFARALARWQGMSRLPESGVMDGETWRRMVDEFQSRRIDRRNYPPADSLVVVPAADFYDPERPPELRQVERAAYSAYKRMIAAATRDESLGLKTTRSGELDASEPYLKIISAFRTREYQKRLRKSAPRSTRAGLAVNSPHFTGRALDLYVGGEPVSTKDTNRGIQTSTPVYKWLVKNAARYGFRPYFYEPWHWEYVPN
jgi:hypothetical protein